MQLLLGKHGFRITCQLALTPNEHALGLSKHAELAEDEGMLFLFPQVGTKTFWMSSVPFGIDLVGIDAHSKVSRIVEGALPGMTERWTFSKVSAVLEVPAGVCRKAGLRVGDLVATEEMAKDAQVDPERDPELDEHSARELELYVENDGELYRMRQAIEANLARKIKRGVYDPSLAWKAWLPWVEAGAKKYMREFDAQGARLQDVFPKQIRHKVAQDFAFQFEYEPLANEPLDAMRAKMQELGLGPVPDDLRIVLDSLEDEGRHFPDFHPDSLIAIALNQWGTPRTAQIDAQNSPENYDARGHGTPDANWDQSTFHDDQDISPAYWKHMLGPDLGEELVDPKNVDRPRTKQVTGTAHPRTASPVLGAVEWLLNNPQAFVVLAKAYPGLKYLYQKARAGELSKDEVVKVVKQVGPEAIKSLMAKKAQIVDEEAFVEKVATVLFGKMDKLAWHEDRLNPNIERAVISRRELSAMLGENAQPDVESYVLDAAADQRGLSLVGDAAILAGLCDSARVGFANRTPTLVLYRSVRQ